MSAPTLAQLTARYRALTQRWLRVRVQPGNARAIARSNALSEELEAIDSDLHARGQHDLRNSLLSERVGGLHVIQHLLGKPDETFRDLDGELENFTFHRARVEKILAELPRGAR